MLAQDEPRPPGVRLSFDASQTLTADTNLGLDPGGEDATTQTITELTFGLLSETPFQRFAAQADAILRLVDGPDESGASFDGPDLSFDYDRNAANAALSVGGSFSRRDVTFLRDLDDFVNEDGTIDLPDDFDDLEGEGTRQSLTLAGTLTLRQRARSGITLSASLADLDYIDTTSSELADNRRLSFGADLRLTFSEAAQANVGVQYSVFDEDGSTQRETVAFDVGASVDRPNGAITAQVDVVDTEDGVRTALSFGRDLALPLGGLSGTLGVARDASGDVNLTGSLGLQRRLPRGALRLSLTQAVLSDSDDEERVVTTLSAGLSRDLTRRASLSLDALYADSRATEEGEDVRNLSLGASSRLALTPDWGLSLSYRHEIRDDEDSGRADNDSIGLTLTRRFAGSF